MSLYTIPSETLTGIADAIRAKTQEAGGIAPEEMAAKIASITTEPVLQSKTVTPGASSQTVDADDGYDGLDEVTVTGDADLVAGNIKKDVEIFGVTGTFEGSATLEEKSVTITANGTQEITPSSGVAGISKITIITAVSANCPHGDGNSLFLFSQMLVDGMSWSGSVEEEE